ncbi:hypothetical protein PCANC_02661 [Puccinia coronata f. sp. avenae]|uniref:Transcription activator of gluconeogenesis ERT1 n=1 Tax=Puccinia coronata f. sp. avenae TaxID=200324 RepID=A0A2N5W5K5_9BASI|nr:hypothetical protein PCANC_02661 [Puccinia coronata f. sp. avenae]
MMHTTGHLVPQKSLKSCAGSAPVEFNLTLHSPSREHQSRILRHFLSDIDYVSKDQNNLCVGCSIFLSILTSFRHYTFCGDFVLTLSVPGPAVPCWSFEQDANRFWLGFPKDFASPRELYQRHTYPEESKRMSRSHRHKSLYDAENPEAICPRPTLPSLRSQVGEYLPESSTSSQPNFHHSYYHQNATMPSESGSRRLSISSSSLTPVNAPRSAMIRTPSTDGRRYSSSSTLHSHPTLLPSSPGNASGGMINRTPSSNTSGYAPPSTATRSTVSVACTNCRSAHLACSDGRPCRRCLQTGRAATCIDVEPKKRGRPRASDLTSVGVTTSMMRDLSTDATNTPATDSEDLVIIMSTSLRCARLTSSIVQTLGLPLKTVLEQPFSSFIHPDEKQEYARFSLGLLAYPVASDKWIPFKFEGYLGSAFGAHPSDPESLRYTYVVLRLSSIGRAPRGDIRSPPSSNSSSPSIAEKRREELASMSYYGQGSSSSRSASRGRDQTGHRQSLGGFYEPSYETYRPPSRSGFF